MNLLRVLGIVSAMTLISRVTGFVRDVLVAGIFGTSYATDAFFVAFRIPNMLRRLFAEGVLSQAFVPTLGLVKEKEGRAAAQLLMNRVFTFLVLLTTVLSITGMILSPIIVHSMVPGFIGQPSFVLTIHLLRIVFPYLIFIAVASLYAGILNTWHHFLTPAFSPTLLNVSFILSMVLFAQHGHHDIYILAWAVLVGGFLQILIQIPVLWHKKLIPALDYHILHISVTQMLKRMGPMIISSSVAQISLFISTLLASFLPKGSISWIYFADRLLELPIGLLGAALGTILLPTLTNITTRNTHDTQYAKVIDWGLRTVVLFAVPATIGLATLAGPILQTLFFHGAFSQYDIEQTRAALLGYTVGIVPIIGIKVLAPGYYATQNTTTPVKIALLSLLVTQMANIVLIGKLQQAGLTLSISIGAWCNASLLYFGLQKSKRYHPQQGWRALMLQVLIASSVMMLPIEYGLHHLEWVHCATHTRFTRLFSVCICSATLYFAVLWLLGMRLRHFLIQTQGTL